MEEVDSINYEAEVRAFCHKITVNENALKNFLSFYETGITATCKRIYSNTRNTLEERKKVIEGIREVRRSTQQFQADQGHEREALDHLKREMEKMEVVVQGKKEEVARQKEILAECEQKLKNEETMVAETKVKNQRRIDQAKSSIQLFKTHLGLDMSYTGNNILILKFSQVSRSQPDSECMLELRLEGDKYFLLGSHPPLPSLPQLQEELNTSGNLVACVVKIRKLYERINTKRLRE